jgi:hypothetical protein
MDDGPMTKIVSLLTTTYIQSYHHRYNSLSHTGTTTTNVESSLLESRTPH